MASGIARSDISPCRFVGYEFLGIRVDDVPKSALVDEMARSMVSGEKLLVLHANAWLITLAKSRPWLQRWIRGADIVYVDGAGAQVAARVLAGATPTRSTAPDWIDSLGHIMAAQSSSIFWLGGQEEVIQQAAEHHAAVTGVRIAGWHHGFFDKALGSAENQAVIDSINASGADLLVVNMGMPLQEQWLHDNWRNLNVTVALTAGALADRVAGLVKRPPRWVIAGGFEWMTRLLAEPRRLWRRYLVGLPVFGMLIVLELLAIRLARLCNRHALAETAIYPPTGPARPLSLTIEMRDQ